MDTALKETEKKKDVDLSCAQLPQFDKRCTKSYLVIKRMVDFLVAATALLLLWFPMIVIGVLIRIDSEGPAIFRQERMGRKGKVFIIYKFRTMRRCAPSEVASRELANPEQYMTKLGAFLRRSSLDELPQLWNIVRGDMSFVGYRPVCLTEKNLNELRKQKGVFTLRPGVTGLAQVCGRDNVDFDEKAELDATYVRHCSAKLDIWCLFRTIGIVISGEGVI